MMPRSMAMPISAGDEEGEGQGDGERIVEQARERVLRMTSCTTKVV